MKKGFAFVLMLVFLAAALLSQEAERMSGGNATFSAGDRLAQKYSPQSLH